MKKILAIMLTAVLLLSTMTIAYAAEPNDDDMAWALCFPQIRRNRTGGAVRAAQLILKYNTSSQYSNLAVDGSFGATTESAVIYFQSHNNLTADGVVGMNTWDKMEGGLSSQVQQRREEDFSRRTPGKAFAGA